ncbi:MAG TPA: 4'-phosphopantetheinyl transferase superfamily protein [Magnetovibrio sp.]
MATMIKNPPFDAQLWLAEPGDDPQQDIQLLLQFLDPEEHERYAAFKVDHARWSYVVAHALCRIQLSLHFGGAPAAWRFRREATGRPVLESSPAGFMADAFSISHAPKAAASALLLTPPPLGRSIGIDVEDPTREMSPILPLARRYFHHHEYEMLECLPEIERKQAFFDIWTIKEAVTKATGKGLQQAFSSFEVNTNPPFFIGYDDDLQPSTAWSIRQGATEGGALWALALRYSTPYQPALDVRYFKGGQSICIMAPEGKN